MPTKDHAGYVASGASAASIEAFEEATDQFRNYVGDPLAGADRALAVSPGMVMAHALKAWLFLLGTEPEGLSVARACLDSAKALPADDRERGHLAAIEHHAATREPPAASGSAWASSGARRARPCANRSSGNT